MDKDAVRRIRRADPGEGPGLVFFVVFSVLVHALVFSAVVFFPGFRERREAVDLINVTLTALPAGPAGGGGKSEELKPEEKVKKPPEEEPVKAAEKTPRAKPRETEKKQPIRPEKNYVVPDEPRGPGVGPVGGGTAKADQLVGPIVVEGGINSPLLAMYLKRLQDMVYRRWVVPSLTGRSQPKAVLFFTIDKKGRITDLKVEKSSGNVTYDNSALAVIREIKSLGEMPPVLKGDKLGVHYTFIPESK